MSYFFVVLATEIRLEDLITVRIRNTGSIIDHMDFDFTQLCIILVTCSLDDDHDSRAWIRKLNCVWDQIDDDLLSAKFINFHDGIFINFADDLNFYLLQISLHLKYLNGRLDDFSIQKVLIKLGCKLIFVNQVLVQVRLNVIEQDLSSIAHNL